MHCIKMLFFQLSKEQTEVRGHIPIWHVVHSIYFRPVFYKICNLVACTIITFGFFSIVSISQRPFRNSLRLLSSACKQLQFQCEKRVYCKSSTSYFDKIFKIMWLSLTPKPHRNKCRKGMLSTDKTKRTKIYLRITKWMESPTMI